MSTSEKHREFVGEPMGQKEVTAVAGIGPEQGAKLAEGGFDKAYKLFGQYLMHNKDQASFTASLMNDVGMSSHQANSAYNCLSEWAERNM